MVINVLQVFTNNVIDLPFNAARDISSGNGNDCSVNLFRCHACSCIIMWIVVHVKHCARNSCAGKLYLDSRVWAWHVVVIGEKSVAVSVRGQVLQNEVPRL